MQGYLDDYGLGYKEYCVYMSCDGIWGDLIFHYILSRILPIPYMVITPHTTVEFNDERSHKSTHKICSVYNGYNDYSSSSK